MAYRVLSASPNHREIEDRSRPYLLEEIADAEELQPRLKVSARPILVAVGSLPEDSETTIARVKTRLDAKKTCLEIVTFSGAALPAAVPTEEQARRNCPLEELQRDKSAILKNELSARFAACPPTSESQAPRLSALSSKSAGPGQAAGLRFASDADTAAGARQCTRFFHQSQYF